MSPARAPGRPAIDADGRTLKRGGQRPRAMDAVVMPGYFRTLRIPLIEGRDVTDRDAQPGAPPVIVVSQTFARAAWQGQPALGRRVRLTRAGAADGPWREVVGVVGDTRTSTF